MSVENASLPNALAVGTAKPAAPGSQRLMWGSGLLLLLVALALLAMAAFDRFEADDFEQRMRPLRELSAVRAQLGSQSLQPAAGDAANTRIRQEQADRVAWLYALERLGVLGSLMNAAPLQLANDIAPQASALHAKWAVADLASSPWSAQAEDRPALAALLQEIDRVERLSEQRLAALRAAQRQRYALAWLLLAAVIGGVVFAAWRVQRRLQATAEGAHLAAAEHWHMLDILPQMVWICDHTASALYLNRRWVQFSGRPMSELLGKGWLELLHPDDHGRVLQEWREAQASGTDALSDFRLRRADGVYRRCNANFGVSGDAQGQPTRWFGTSMDIDSVHQAHEALRRSEEFHRSTLAALNEGVIAFDDKGRVTGANPAAQRMLALRLEDMVHRSSSEWGLRLLDEEGQLLKPAQLPVARVLASGQSHRNVVVSVTRSDGMHQWLCVNSEPVHGGVDGALSAVVCSFDDITAQRDAQQAGLQHRDQLELQVDARTRELTAQLQARTQAEQSVQTLNERLQQTERFAKLVADSVPGRLVYWDNAMRCRFVNRTQAEWFNEAPEQVIGRTLREIRGEAVVERVAERVAATLAGQAQEFEQVEYSARGVRADTRVQYIPDCRDGEVKGFVVLATNITRHKQAAQLLRLRNEQLMQARDHADAANQAKTTFLANMSHEIRTPMNAILGFTHMLRREIEDPVHQQRLSRIAGAGTHLLQIINDILDLSKIEAGKFTLDMSDFSLDALLSRTGAMVIEPVREKGLELIVHVEPLPDLLHGDSTRLMQALLNLLSNAVKFTERGVITLRVEMMGQDGGDLTLRFEVRDTGIGIKPEDLGQLFTPFAQADGSSTRLHGGTGLGLAITRRIAEQMGGEAGAESWPGAGSRFWFTARLRIAEHDEAHAHQQMQPRALAGMRVLVADDLREARDTLAEICRGLGMAVDAAEDGTQALDLWTRAAAMGRPYELALLDWAMPGLDGIETGSRLVDSAQPPRAMVLVSARDRASIHQLAREAGFGAVLMKPVTARTLGDTLLRLLNASPPGAGDAGDTRPQSLADGTEGARILLAEDNPVNQEVAVQLLEAMGVTVDVAGDGEEALRMARARPYGLVLMDMQMPRMDGLQATREMRLDPALAHLPIVAMTANAFAEDRQACLDAGMNDHLTKPVDPRVLHATLVRWLPAQLGRTPMPAPLLLAALATAPVPVPVPVPVPAPVPVPVPVPVSVSQAPSPARPPASSILPRMADILDLPRALEYAAGQPEILLRVLQQFVSHYADMGATLMQQLNAGDLEGPARSLHSLRGVSGMIGADRLRDMAGALEESVAAKQPVDALKAQAGALRQELNTLVASVAERLV